MKACPSEALLARHHSPIFAFPEPSLTILRPYLTAFVRRHHQPRMLHSHLRPRMPPPYAPSQPNTPFSISGRIGNRFLTPLSHGERGRGWGRQKRQLPYAALSASHQAVCGTNGNRNRDFRQNRQLPHISVNLQVFRCLRVEPSSSGKNGNRHLPARHRRDRISRGHSARQRWITTSAATHRYCQPCGSPLLVGEGSEVRSRIPAKTAMSLASSFSVFSVVLSSPFVHLRILRYLRVEPSSAGRASQIRQQPPLPVCCVASGGSDRHRRRGGIS